MASSTQASCLADPNFAVICAFLERFAESCGITYPTFIDLQEMLENVEQVPQELVDLHIKLLRKARKTVFIEKWEKALIKFCHTYSSQDGWEIERFGYKKSRLEVKLRALKMLLEGQFDLNSKFKASINTLESQNLRSKPLGKDKHGRIYWLQLDSACNVRVYREDHDEESWTLVAQDRVSLVNLLKELSNNEYPLDDNLLNEESVLESDKQLTDTGQNDDIKPENKVLNSDINSGENEVHKTNHNSNSDDYVNNSVKEEPHYENYLMAEEKSIAIESHQANEQVSKSVVVSEAKDEEANSTVTGFQDQKSDLHSESIALVNNSLINNQDKEPKLEDDVIEEPVMYIVGNGNGEDCMTGNPDKETQSDGECQNEINLEKKINDEQFNDSEESSSNATVIPSTNTDKLKAPPKLWTIDTICGVSNDKKTIECVNSSHNMESNENQSKQKNFSSFSIESVLEKKDSFSPDNSACEVTARESNCSIGATQISVKLGSNQISSVSDSCDLRVPSENENVKMLQGKPANESPDSISEPPLEGSLNVISNELDVGSKNNINEECLSKLDEKEFNPTNDENIINLDKAELSKKFETAVMNVTIKSATHNSGCEDANITIEAISNSAVIEENELKAVGEASLIEDKYFGVPAQDDEKHIEAFQGNGLDCSNLSLGTSQVSQEKIKKTEEQIIAVAEESTTDFDSNSEIIEKTEESVSINLANETIIDTKKKEDIKSPITSPEATPNLSEEKNVPSDRNREFSTTAQIAEVLENACNFEPVACTESLSTTHSDEEMDITESSENTEGNNQKVEPESEPECALEKLKTENQPEIREFTKVKEEKKEKKEEISGEIDSDESKTIGNSQDNVEVKIFESGEPLMEEMKSPVHRESEPKNDVNDEKRKDLSSIQNKPDFQSKTSGKKCHEIQEAVKIVDDLPTSAVSCDKKETEECLNLKIETAENKADKSPDGQIGENMSPPSRRLSRNRKTEKDNTKSEEDQSNESQKEENQFKEEESTEEEFSTIKPEADDSKTGEGELSEGNMANEKGDKEEKARAPLPKGRRRRRRRRTWDKLKKSVKKVGGENENDKKEDGNENSSKPEKAVTLEGGEEVTIKRKGRPKKSDAGKQTTPSLCREIRQLGISEVEIDVPSVRQSRRIAQMKLKEEEERRRIEALQLQEFKSKKKGGKIGKKKSKKAADESYDGRNENNGEEDDDDEDEEEDESDDPVSKKSRDKKSRRKRKKDKLVFDELNPWLSSSGSSTADEEEDEIEEEPREDEELVFKSDHEFSPESDVEDPDYKPIKRARTAKVEESKDEVGKYDDTSCEKCGNNDHPEWILLCDKCDKGWHASCLRPALMIVPEGDWYCPPCEHSALIEKLQQSLIEYDKNRKQRENEELRRKRLAFVGISLDNVLPPTKKSGSKKDEENKNSVKSDDENDEESESDSESKSSFSDEEEPVYRLRERRSNMTSYRYNEYDELIKSALQEEMDAVKGAGNAGRGKDINNIVNAERQRRQELDKEIEEEEEKKVLPESDAVTACEISSKTDSTTVKEGMPAEEREKTNENGAEDQQEESEAEEEENITDEIPAVVPKHRGKKKKSKSLKITSLDFTSEEEDRYSDSDFKGASSEEESDYSLPSETESSDDGRKRRRGGDGPLRRSTRARVSRYDRDFINDDSDDSPIRRKARRSWDSSESSDSDRSWGQRKRRSNKSSQKYGGSKSSGKSKKKKQRRNKYRSESDGSVTPKKKRNRKIKYGGLDDLDEDIVLTRRTRGKKINYQEITGSDSEVETRNRGAGASKVVESDDDFDAENEKDLQEESEEEVDSAEEAEEDEESNSNDEKSSGRKRIASGKKKLLEKIKKKKWVIPDPDDFSENDLMEDEQLDKVAEELDNLDVEEEDILEKILESGDVPIRELNNAVNRAKEEKRLRNEASKGDEKFVGGKETRNAPTMIPGKDSKTLDEIQNFVVREPGKVNAAPFDPNTSGSGSFLLKNLPTDAKYSTPFVAFENQASVPRLQQASSYAPPNAEGLNRRTAETDLINNDVLPRLPEFGNRSGITSSSGRPGSSAVPIPGPGAANSNSMDQSGRQYVGGSGATLKRKLDDNSTRLDNTGVGGKSLDFPFSSGPKEEFSPLKDMEDSPPKKKGRGKGKKSLTETEANAHCQPDMATSVSQLPQTVFPPKGLPAENESVISRILNSPQGTQAYPLGGSQSRFPAPPRNRPVFSPIIPPHFPHGSPRPLPSLRMRHPGTGGALFHAPHPLDPSPSGGGPINIPIAAGGISKGALTAPPVFNRTSAMTGIPPRFVGDPSTRQIYAPRDSPLRPEFSFPPYYGNFQQGIGAASDGSVFQSPPYHEMPFGEETPIGGVIGGKPFEDESGSSEFGGLASYFASQREDDLDA